MYTSLAVSALSKTHTVAALTHYTHYKETLLLSIKTRETEGGGHSHIFTRDIIAAVREFKEDKNRYHMIAVIIALNWSVSELDNINDQIDKVFHFNMNPNKFMGFDRASQIELNRYIQGVLDNGYTIFRLPWE